MDLAGIRFRSSITPLDFHRALSARTQTAALKMSFLDRFFDYFNGGAKERALRNLFKLKTVQERYKYSESKSVRAAALRVARRTFNDLRGLASDEFQNVNPVAEEGERNFVIQIPHDYLRYRFNFPIDGDPVRLAHIPIPIPIRYEPPDPVRFSLHRAEHEMDYWPCVENLFDEGSKYRASQLFFEFQRQCRTCEKSETPASERLQGTIIEKFRNLIWLAKPTCQINFFRYGFNHATRLQFRIDMPIKPGSTVMVGRTFNCFNERLAQQTADPDPSLHVPPELEHRRVRSPIMLTSIDETDEIEDE